MSFSYFHETVNKPNIDGDQANNEPCEHSIDEGQLNNQFGTFI